MKCPYMDDLLDCHYDKDCPVAEYCDMIHLRHDNCEVLIEMDSQDHEDYLSWVKNSNQ